MSAATTRLEVPLERKADPVAIQTDVEAHGAKVVDAMVYENYQGKGPHLLLTIEGAIPADLVDFVKESARNQPTPTKASFMFLRSPGGALWRVGVDDAGQLHVEGAKPGDLKSRKP